MISLLDGLILVLFAMFTYWFFRPSRKEELDNLSLASGSLSRASKSRKSSLMEDDFYIRMKKAGASCIILFGSQTGTAEEFAQQLARELLDYDVCARVLDLSEISGKDLLTLPRSFPAVFLVATYGDGEPTDSASEFHSWLLEGIGDSSRSLKDITFCVFGLGNSTYEKYNQFAKDLDSMLRTLHAKSLAALALGDDDQNLEEDFLRWKECIVPQICAHVGKDAVKKFSDQRLYSMMEIQEPMDESLHYPLCGPLMSTISSGPPTLRNPFIARLLHKSSLQRGGERNFIRCEFEIDPFQISYESGDHVAILPSNNPQLVHHLASLLGIAHKLDTVFTMSPSSAKTINQLPFPVPCTYRIALSHYLDISQPAKQNVIAAMARHAENASEKSRLQKLVEDKDFFEEYVRKNSRNIVDVLLEHPSVRLPVDHLLELVPRLQCRYYSISSSSKKTRASVALTAVVLRYKASDGNIPVREGVATTWLERLPLDAAVPLFIRRSLFHLPTDASIPLILIGPGTGVAPFIGFLEERSELISSGIAVGEAILYYGCRQRSKDFIYSDELETYVKRGALTSLKVAFSRDQTEKIYVQDLMWNDRAHLGELISKQRASVYVCGDAKKMARDVHRTIIHIIKDYGQCSDEAASAQLKELRKSGRYLEDVWS